MFKKCLVFGLFLVVIFSSNIQNWARHILWKYLSLNIGKTNMSWISAFRSLSGALYFFGIHKKTRHTQESKAYTDKKTYTRKSLNVGMKNVFNFCLLVPLFFFGIHKRARHILTRRHILGKGKILERKICFQFLLVGLFLAELCSTLRIRRSTAGTLAHHYFSFEVRKGREPNYDLAEN